MAVVAAAVVIVIEEFRFLVYTALCVEILGATRPSRRTILIRRRCCFSWEGVS
jgi:hypothetical protein